jgi:hypothetical protein
MGSALLVDGEDLQRLALERYPNHLVVLGSTPVQLTVLPDIVP